MNLFFMSFFSFQRIPFKTLKYSISLEDKKQEFNVQENHKYVLQPILINVVKISTYLFSETTTSSPKQCEVLMINNLIFGA